MTIHKNQSLKPRCFIIYGCRFGLLEHPLFVWVFGVVGAICTCISRKHVSRICLVHAKSAFDERRGLGVLSFFLLSERCSLSVSMRETSALLL